MDDPRPSSPPVPGPSAAEIADQDDDSSPPRVLHHDHHLGRQHPPLAAPVAAADEEEDEEDLDDELEAEDNDPEAAAARIAAREILSVALNGPQESDSVVVEAGGPTREQRQPQNIAGGEKLGTMRDSAGDLCT